MLSVAPTATPHVKKYRTVPMDNLGNFCGMGKLKKYPKLYFWNMEKPLKSVCVSECPKFDYSKLIAEEKMVKKGGKMGFLEFTKLRNIFFMGKSLDETSKEFLTF